LLYGNIFYFTALVVLYLWMRDREAYNPRLFMQFYNLSCVVLAGISGVCILLYKLSYKEGRFVCNIRGGQLNDSADGLLQWGFWFFYHQKYWEFLDTFIFMLRKSYRQVSFLHVFHHSSITLVTAIAVQFDSSGDTYLAALLNSWVHVLMYGHYFLTSIGSKASAPLRPYLTSLQLIQFLIILGQNIAALYFGNTCGFAQWHNCVMVAYMVSMLVLFARFFVQSYGGAKKKAP
jgi:elongation of very long chain fatty acids protein 4